MNLHNRVILLITAPELLLLRSRFVLYKSAETNPNLWGEVPQISPVSLNFIVYWFPCLIPAQNHFLARKHMEKQWMESIYWSKSIKLPFFPGKPPAQRVFPPTFFHVSSVFTASPRLRWRLLDCRYLPRRRRAPSVHLLPARGVLSGHIGIRCSTAKPGWTMVY